MTLPGDELELEYLEIKRRYDFVLGELKRLRAEGVELWAQLERLRPLVEALQPPAGSPERELARLEKLLEEARHEAQE